MPSFRCKIKKLRFQGILTEKETERILDALDKADKEENNETGHQENKKQNKES